MEQGNTSTSNMSPAIRNHSGRLVGSRQKEILINLYKEHMNTDPTMKYKEMLIKLSHSSGIGTSTIAKTISEYKRYGIVKSPNVKRFRLSTSEKINDLDKLGIRRKVHSFLVHSELPTLDKLLQAVNDDESLPNFTRTTLYRVLRSMDFEYAKRNGKSVLTEREDLINWRRNYSDDIRKYCEQKRPIYDLDKTWVDEGGCTEQVRQDKTIQSKNDAFQKGLTTGAINPTDPMRSEVTKSDENHQHESANADDSLYSMSKECQALMPPVISSSMRDIPTQSTNGGEGTSVPIKSEIIESDGNFEFVSVNAEELLYSVPEECPTLNLPAISSLAWNIPTESTNGDEFTSVQIKSEIVEPEGSPLCVSVKAEKSLYGLHEECQTPKPEVTHSLTSSIPRESTDGGEFTPVPIKSELIKSDQSTQCETVAEGNALRLTAVLQSDAGYETNSIFDCFQVIPLPSPFWSACHVNGNVMFVCWAENLGSVLKHVIVHKDLSLQIFVANREVKVLGMETVQTISHIAQTLEKIVELIPCKGANGGRHAKGCSWYVQKTKQCQSGPQLQKCLACRKLYESVIKKRNKM